MTNQTNEFPCTISHNGMDYSSTGKTGTNIKTGKHVAEMEAEDASRVWIALDGSVFAE